MKLYIINHTYRFAAEEAMTALLGCAPSETLVRKITPRPAPDDALITRMIGERSGCATAVIRSGGRRCIARVDYDSDGLDLPDDFTFPADRTEAADADPAVRELVRRRQHALKLAIARAVEKYGGLGEWGSLTGMRPAKLARRLLDERGEEDARRELTDYYLLSPERAGLALDAAKYGSRAGEWLGERAYIMYVGVPFCPSRCAYCSFVSESVARSGALREPYVEKLLSEIKLRGELMRSSGLKLRALYVGGGTPTTLSAEQLRRVLSAIADEFRPDADAEITVEAGRPDTIDRERLEALKACGVRRISVNPQSLNPLALERAGRPHSAEDFFSAYALAREVGFDVINTDLIAGLDGDTPNDFADTVEKILALAPENITIHTLARKRSSDLNRRAVERKMFHVEHSREDDSTAEQTVGRRDMFHVEQFGSRDPVLRAEQSDAAAMLERAYPRLRESGYAPYYLYRQKFMAAPLENTGWALDGCECAYNSLLMDETALCVALGAGGMTKLVRGERVERLSNPKYAAEYIACDLDKNGERLRNWLADG